MSLRSRYIILATLLIPSTKAGAQTDAYWKALTDPACHSYIKQRFIDKTYGGWDYGQIQSDFDLRKTNHDWTTLNWAIADLTGNLLEYSKVKQTTQLNDRNALAVALNNMKLNKEHRYIRACEGQGRGFGSPMPCDHIRFYCSNNMIGAMQSSLAVQRAHLKNAVSQKKCELWKNLSYEKCVQFLIGGIQKEANLISSFQKNFKEGYFNENYSKDVIRITDGILADVKSELKNAQDAVEAARVADQAIKDRGVVVEKELKKNADHEDRLVNLKALNECKEKLRLKYPEMYEDYKFADAGAACANGQIITQKNYSIMKESLGALEKKEGYAPRSERSMLENLIRVNEGMQDKIDAKKQAALAGIRTMDVNGEVSACGDLLKLARKKCKEPVKIDPIPIGPLDNYPSIPRDVRMSGPLPDRDFPLQVFKSNCRLHHYLRNKYVNGVYIPEHLDSCSDLEEAAGYDYGPGTLNPSGPSKTAVFRQRYKQFNSKVARPPESVITNGGKPKPTLSLIRDDAVVAMSLGTAKEDPTGELLRGDVADFVNESFGKMKQNNADVLAKLKKINSNYPGCLSPIAKQFATTLLNPVAPEVLLDMAGVLPKTCDEQARKLIIDLLFSAPDVLKEVILDGTPEGAELWCKYSEAFLKHKWYEDAANSARAFALEIAAAVTSPIPPLSFAFSAVKELEALEKTYKDKVQTEKYSKLLSDAFSAGMTDESMVKSYRDKVTMAKQDLDDQKVATAMLLLKINKLGKASKPLVFNPGNILKDPKALVSEEMKDVGKKLILDMPAKTVFKLVLTDTDEQFEKIYQEYAAETLTDAGKKVLAPDSGTFKDMFKSAIEETVKEKK